MTYVVIAAIVYICWLLQDWRAAPRAKPEPEPATCELQKNGNVWIRDHRNRTFIVMNGATCEWVEDAVSFEHAEEILARTA